MAAQLLTGTFLRTGELVASDRWHATILHVLQGEISADGVAVSVELSKDGASTLLLNAGEQVRISPVALPVVFVCRVDLRRLSRLAGGRLLRFACGPAVRHHERYAELEHLLRDYVRSLSDAGDFAGLRREASELAVARCLLDGFLDTTSAAAQTRAEQFRSYADAHYDEPIGLADAARHFGLTTEYFAKVFKRETGETFLTYLNYVRLNVASDLLVESDETVSRVAMDAGFPNTASLNQAFKRAFGLTPSQYRKQNASRGGTSSRCLPSDSVGGIEVKEPPAQRVEVSIDLAYPSSADSLRPWMDMISVGTPATLGIARVREQVRWLHGRLPVRYCRVACDFSREAGGTAGRQADDAFDFLVQEGFRIHLAMEASADVDAETYARRVEAVLRRSINRYSLDTVQAWRLELRARSGTDPASDAFVGLFALLTERAMELGLTRPLCAPGCRLSSGAANMRSFLRKIKARGLSLSGATIAVRPVVAQGDGATEFVRTADRRFMRNQLLLAREALVAEGYDPSLVMVGGWSDTLEGGNVMNDSCFEAANVCQQLLSCQDITASICPDWSLDALFAQPVGTGAAEALSGRPGLVTIDGIPKPSFNALEFLGHIGENVVCAQEDVVASTNRMGNLQIVAHNCASLGASYLVTPEQSVTWENMTGFFDDAKPRELSVHVEGARRGTYLVKKRIVNSRCGSVGDAAQEMRLWCMEEPSRSELEYLRARSQPGLMLEVVISDDGTIDLSHVMQPNEVVYLHLIYLY